MSLSDNYVPLRQIGDGVTTQFTGNWNVLSSSYLRVFLESVSTGVLTPVDEGGAADEYTLQFTASGFTVTFNTAPTSANYVIVARQVALDQTTPYKTSKGFQGDVQEASFDKLTAINQDQQDEIDRGLKYPVGSPLVGVLPNQAIDGYGIVCDGVTGSFRLTQSNLDTIVTDAAASAAAAAASASDAADSENAAEASETAAANSESAAAASAAAAQAAVDSAPYRDTISLTNADSPYTVLASQNGFFFSLDTSSGPIVLNLPQISTLALPFNQRFKKETNDADTVTINCFAGDEFGDGTTTQVIQSVGGIDVIAEPDTAPDSWKTARFGASAGNPNLDRWVAGDEVNSGEFTPDVTTQLTLTSNPGSENAVGVSFDGVNQHKSQFSVAGNVVTFAAAIPSGVSEVEITYGSTLSIGVAGDGTVGFIKMATSALAVVADLVAGTASKIVTAAAFKDWVDNNLPFSKEYVSPNTAFAFSTEYLLTHGLGSRPKLVRVSIVCVVAEAGYAVGDEIDLTAGSYITSATSTRNGMRVAFENDTQINLGVGTFVSVLQKGSSGVSSNLTAANWEFVVRAYA